MRRDRLSHYSAIALSCALTVLGVLQLRGNGGLIGWVLAAFGLLALRFLLRPRPAELALVAKCLAGIVGAIALFVAGLFAAWESSEVVVLRYTGADGARVETRLWVVDFDGEPCVAMGSAKQRVAALEANPEVELLRGDGCAALRVRRAAGRGADRVPARAL